VFRQDEKMSKSLGNMIFVDELLRRYPASAIRRMFLRHHYRSDWGYDERSLAAEANGEARGAHDDVPTNRDAFLNALRQDLDTPHALAILDAASADGQSWVDEGTGLLGLAGLGHD
jgi:L-cysteine:1D-myo-inositol 2-amino-2-deoxy-alpha-D-glucopyranoside ligase